MDTVSTAATEREQRLHAALAACLQTLEQGTNSDLRNLLTRYAEFTAELSEFLAGREQLECLTAPLREVLHAAQQAGSAGDARTEELSRVAYQPGQAFGDYELLEVIGQGGMGVVYKARQQSLQRLVAVKMFGASRPASAAERGRFQAEAEAAASLDHPRIVPIHEVGEWQGQAYYTMKLFTGGSLAEQLPRFGSDLRAAARLVAETARGVHHAHRHGILHRDLKPSNILLDAEGRPHVADFGLAKRLEADSSLTQSGAIVGTPSYMAPEQALGKQGHVTVATDVHGLGAVLYVLLTGKPPFGADNVLETLEQVKARPPEPPSTTCPRLDRDLETICLKCLEKEPERRYPSTEALAEDLERWLAGEPILARRTGWFERALRWCRRNPWPALALGLTGVSLLAVAFISFFFALYQSRTADQLRGKETEVTEALERSEQHRQEAARLSASLALDRAVVLCEQGEIGTGLLWLTRSLELVPAEETDLAWTIRTNLAWWGREVHTLEAVLDHRQPVLCAAFSSDGRKVFTGGHDQTVRVWDTRTGRPAGSPWRHPGKVLALVPGPGQGQMMAVSMPGTDFQWSPDRAYTDPAVRSLAHGSVFVWDVAAGRLLESGRLGDRGVRSLALSPDCRRLLLGQVNGTAQGWDVHSGKLFGPPLRHKDAVWAVAYSPDGRLMATGTLGGPAYLRDAATGLVLGTPLRGVRYGWALAFSPDSRHLLTDGPDGTSAWQYSVATGSPVSPPLRHTAAVSSVAYSPNGRLILTASYDRTARLWEAETGKPVGSPLRHPGPVQAALFSPNGQKLVTTCWYGLGRLWRVAPGNALGLVHDVPDVIEQVALDASGRTVLIVTPGSGQVRVWETGPGKQIDLPGRGDVSGPAVALSPDGRRALIGDKAGSVRIWDLASGKLRPLPFQMKNEIWSLAFSDSGTLILAGEERGGLLLWDLRLSQRVGPVLQPAPWPRRAAAFGPDGRTVLLGSWNGAIQLMDVATGRPVASFPSRSRAIDAVAFGSDGRTVLTADNEGMIQRWETSTGQPLGLPLQHRGVINGVVASPAGSMVLLINGDGTARLWDVRTRKPISGAVPFTGPASTAAFSRDGRTFLTTSPRTRVQLWRVPAPVAGTVERLTLWAQVVTGMELDRDGVVRLFETAEEWEGRRQGLQQMGGPPDGVGP